MKLKYVQPKKLKILILVFTVVGLWGIGFGLWRGSLDPGSMNNFMIVVLGVGLFLSLEKWSSWYFDQYIVPAQQKELNIKN